MVVGRLTGVFGIRGELKCRPAGEGTSIAPGRSFEIEIAGQTRTIVCTTMRRHHDKLLLGFEGIDSPEAARALAGCELRVDDVALELGPDEYLDKDLIGLRLLDARGEDLGRVVVGVEHLPAQDCLVVDPGRALVPLVKAFIARIDLGAKTIVTTLPEGLFD